MKVVLRGTSQRLFFADEVQAVYGNRAVLENEGLSFASSGVGPRTFCVRQSRAAISGADFSAIISGPLNTPSELNPNSRLGLRLRINLEAKAVIRLGLRYEAADLPPGSRISPVSLRGSDRTVAVGLVIVRCGDSFDPATILGGSDSGGAKSPNTGANGTADYHSNGAVGLRSHILFFIRRTEPRCWQAG